MTPRTLDEDTGKGCTFLESDRRYRQHVDDDIQCRFDAERRVFIVGGDPPDPDQSGFAGTVYLVQVCKKHDPAPRRSMPLPRQRTSTPIGERPRR
jgi:hypothetical protein